MDATIGKVLKSISDFFSGAASGSADEFPLCDADIISGCEKELAEAQKAQDEGLQKKYIMRLSWALVHSKIPGDIQRGLAMLEDLQIEFSLVVNDASPMKLREKLYLLDVGYYRSNAFSRSRDCIEKSSVLSSLASQNSFGSVLSEDVTEDASNFGEDVPEDAQRRERKKWTPSDDILLISSW